MWMNLLDWDSPIPESLQPRWRQWIAEVKTLDSVVIKRCLKPTDFDEVVTAEINHFSDASTMGYGQCSYLRLIDPNQRVHCSLIMAKARVTPIKPVTIPRLELMAALVSVRISAALLEELDISNVVEWFWTDSSVVLSYIRNEAGRFHVFVANRVQQIRDYTDPYQCNYICSANNPADLASRGAMPKELMDKIWFNGPDFLWESKAPFAPCQIDNQLCLENDDPEVRAHAFNITMEPTQKTSILDRLTYFSDWTRALRTITHFLKYKEKLRERASTKEKDAMENQPALAVIDLPKAKVEILEQIQKEAFSQELEDLSRSTRKTVDGGNRNDRHLRCTSPLYRLDPFLHEHYMLHVGGRLIREVPAKI